MLVEFEFVGRYGKTTKETVELSAETYHKLFGERGETVDAEKS